MSVVSEIHSWNRGRELQRLRLKYGKMETDAFSFFRGTAHLFYRDWPLDTALDDAPLVWACGDLHLENFSAFRGDDGRAYFDVNDFDEAALATASWDLARLLTAFISPRSCPMSPASRLRSSTATTATQHDVASWIPTHRSRSTCFSAPWAGEAGC